MFQTQKILKDVLEASFSKSLRDAVSTTHSVTLYDSKGVAEQWSAVSFLGSDKVFDAIVTNNDVGSWIWILVGYQAGLDTVHIYGEEKIRFVQVTAEKKHDYMFLAIYGLLGILTLWDMTITHVDFVAVRPIDDDRDFFKGDVTGRLDQGWNDFSGNPCDARDPPLNARILKINWSI